MQIQLAINTGLVVHFQSPGLLQLASERKGVIDNLIQRL